MSKNPVIDESGEGPELTAEDFKLFKPLAKSNPSLLARIKKGVGEREAQINLKPYRVLLIKLFRLLIDSQGQAFTVYQPLR